MGLTPNDIPAFLCDYCHRPIIHPVVYKELVNGLMIFYCSLRCKMLDNLKRSK
jgi:hypothetical protein